MKGDGMRVRYVTLVENAVKLEFGDQGLRVRFDVGHCALTGCWFRNGCAVRRFRHKVEEQFELVASWNVSRDKIVARLDSFAPPATCSTPRWGWPCPLQSLQPR